MRLPRRLAVPTPNTPTRVHGRLMLALAGVGLVVVMVTGVAFADGHSPDAGLLGVFNQIDGHGISLVQYQMSLDEGGLTSPITAALAFFSIGLWSLYVFFIGFVGWLVNWIISMEWLNWIINPLTRLQTTLREQLLNPLGLSSISTTGLIGFLLLLAGGIGGWHLIRGNRGRGLGEWLMSATAAAVAVGVLTSPVTLFLGNSAGPAAPLEKARDLGVSLARLADGQSITGTDGPHFGSILIDAFVRPAHQLVNYGTYIDVDDTKCVATYDKTLKAGPYADAAAARDKIGACDSKLQDQAEAVSYFRLITLVMVFEQTALLVSVLILVFAVLTVLSVLMLGWSALKILIHAPMAIAPGDSREPLIRDLVDIVVGYIYLVANLLVLSIILQLIKAVFASPGQVPILVRFVGVEMMLWAGIVLLIINFLKARKTGCSLHSRLVEKLRWTKRDTVGEKAREWASTPAYGGPMAPGSPYGSFRSLTGRAPVSGGTGGYGGAGGGGGVAAGYRAAGGLGGRSPRLSGRLASTGFSAFGGLLNSPNGMLQSKGGRLAFGAVVLGAAAATGGTSLAARSGIADFKGAVKTGKVLDKATVVAGRATGKAGAAFGTTTGTAFATAGTTTGTAASAASKATRKAATSTARAAGNAASATQRTVNEAQSVHQGYRTGARHATTGRPRLDTILQRTAAGHNYLEEHARAARQAVKPVATEPPAPSTVDDHAPDAHRAPRTAGATTPPFTAHRPNRPTRPTATVTPSGRPPQPGATTPGFTRPVRPATAGTRRPTNAEVSNPVDDDGEVN